MKYCIIFYVVFLGQLESIYAQSNDIISTREKFTKIEFLYDTVSGIGALSSLSSTLEYTPDGIDFTNNKLSVKVKDFPKAPGAYRTDLTSPSTMGNGLIWGISMVTKNNECYLIRYKINYITVK